MSTTVIITGCAGQLGSHLFRLCCSSSSFNMVFGILSPSNEKTNFPLLEKQEEAQVIKNAEQEQELFLLPQQQQNEKEENESKNKKKKRIFLVHGDISDQVFVSALFSGVSKQNRNKNNNHLLVINTAATTNVQEAFLNQEKAMKNNVESVRLLCSATASSSSSPSSSASSSSSFASSKFIQISTDMVFNGAKSEDQKQMKEPSFYNENEATCPLSHYGKTKAMSEQIVTEFCASSSSSSNSSFSSLVIRVPLMFGAPHSTKIAQGGTFISQTLSLLKGDSLNGFEDEIRTPLSFNETAEIILKIASSSSSSPPSSSSKTKILHVAGSAALSRKEMLEQLKCFLSAKENEKLVKKLDGTNKSSEAKIKSVSRNDFPASEPRPADLSLDISNLRELLFPSQQQKEEKEEEQKKKSATTTTSSFAEGIKEAIELWVKSLELSLKEKK